MTDAETNNNVLLSEVQIREIVTRAINEADYDAYTSEGADRLRFQTEFSQAALKNLLLVNGGALLALLTVIGNSDVSFDKRGMWWAFAWFGSGLICSLAAYFGAYFSQGSFMDVAISQAWNAQSRSHGLEPSYDIKKSMHSGNIYLWFGIGAAVLSLVSFILGAFVALNAIL